MGRFLVLHRSRTELIRTSAFKGLACATSHGRQSDGFFFCAAACEQIHLLRLSFTWSGSAAPAVGPSLTWAPPRFWPRETLMHPKAGHSMTQRAPSTHPAEGPPTLKAPPSRPRDGQKAEPDPHNSRGRTSRPGLPACDRHQGRSACSGTQRHPPCRSLGGRRPADQTTDVTDTKARETPSRGRYQAVFYKAIQRHSTIGYSALLSSSARWD
jgi:hypothetical protein